MRRAVVALGIVALLASGVLDGVAHAGRAAAPVDVAGATVRRLVAAYPDRLRAAGGAIAFIGGPTLAVDDGVAYATFDERLAHADLVDQLSIPYPAGCPVRVPAVNEDPGRLRDEAFFRAMYGGSAAAVRARLRRVLWFGGSLQVTTVNGVDRRLAAVAARLANRKALRPYLVRPGGGFLWRTVAGTDQLSAHSFGIAVDINTGHSDYWRWDGIGRAPRYRNRIPCEIASAFEAEGFVWGAKWYHYDTMHFEYRPELFVR